MKVTVEETRAVANLVRELCGLNLDDTKGYLIENRLSKIFEDLGSSSIDEFCRQVRLGAKEIQGQVIDAITTQETTFFRDSAPYDAIMHHVLPMMIDQRGGSGFGRRLRVWSAASSTGQEPYSLAMALSEVIPNIASWDVSITATDVSAAAIGAASRGMFDQLAMQRASKPEIVKKYLEPVGTQFQIRPDLRRLVHFQQLNLLQPFPAMFANFDLILCRNVAIYFEPQQQESLFRRLSEKLAPGGCLFLGAGESLDDAKLGLKRELRCHSCFYQKP